MLLLCTIFPPFPSYHRFYEGDQSLTFSAPTRD